MCVNIPVDGVSGKSFHEWAIIRLPVKLYGWGFRSLAETCLPAYLGTLETSVPRMGTISPILQQTWGGDECWGSGANSDTRWSALLGSGCREAEEITRGWNIPTTEAQQAANWLGCDVEKVFSISIAG